MTTQILYYTKLYSALIKSHFDDENNIHVYFTRGSHVEADMCWRLYYTIACVYFALQQAALDHQF